MASRSIKTSILDTNVLLRFLVGDNEKQQKQAIQWFEEAWQNKRAIFVVPLVIAEACFVLESFYKKERQEIAEALEVFIGQRWLIIQDRDILLGLWDWYRKGLHFVDSYLLSWSAINDGTLLTFDKKAKSYMKIG